MRRRVLPLALGVLILAAIQWTPAGTTPGEFTPFVPQALPHTAIGDFDRDGRQDVALIQDGGSPDVSVRLSGPSGTVSLAVNAVSLIATDIDQDGDLDLVAVAPSGQVVTWLNDGGGRFTMQEASRSSRLSPEAIVVDALYDVPLALGATPPGVVAPRTRNGSVVVTLIRPPTVPPAFDLGFLSLPGLRAPPFSASLG
jgi:hypothetical protein